MTDRLVPSCAWLLKAVMLFALLESMSMYCGVKHICTVLGVRRGFDLLTEHSFFRLDSGTLCLPQNKIWFSPSSERTALVEGGVIWEMCQREICQLQTFLLQLLTVGDTFHF